MKSWIVRETPRGFVCGPKSYFAWCNDCTKRKKPCLADWLSSQERGLGEGLAGNELAQRGRRADGALSLHLMSREEARAAPLTTGFRYAPRRQ
jgi:hypothetical protein